METFKCNRHRVDEIADVRAEISRLKNREAQLRSELLVNRADLIGTEYEAVIFNYSQSRFDAKAAIRHFGREAMQPFFRKIGFPTVRLKRLSDKPSKYRENAAQYNGEYHGQ